MKHLNAMRIVTVIATLVMVTVSAVADPHRPSITQTVDDSVRVSLRGNISPFVASKSDLGAVDDSVSTGALFVLLGRSSSEQHKLDNYVLGLSTPGSGSYHKWLTPTQFAANFGSNDDDVTSVMSWLQAQGFTVVKVNRAKTSIEFTGTMGNVKSAFKTEVHKFNLDGVGYFANISNPQIPAALAPVVRGVVGLVRAESTTLTAAKSAAVKAKPQLTNDGIGGQTLYMVAGDAAVVYDTPNPGMNPAYTGSTLDGTGVTIGAIETSNLSSTSLQDFANYRIAFLGNTPSQATAYIPTVVVEGPDPGLPTFTTAVGDTSLLLALPAQMDIGDGEISQALAPGSKTILYVAETVDQALARAVDDNIVSIILNNNGTCEASLGAAGNAFLNEEYEQASAQGITVVASTGDMGSSGCFMSGGQYTSGGFSVSGDASTPWNVAVGGTDFLVLYNQSTFSQYATPSTTDGGIAGTAPYYTTALDYIPEAAWNNSTTVFTSYENDTNANDYSGPATGGGSSSQAVCPGTISSTTGDCSGTLAGYTKPAWQSALTPSDGVRDLPDISLFSSLGTSGSNSWVTCQDASLNSFELDCNGPGASPSDFTPYGGTEAAAAAAAGIFALVEQSQGQRLGLVNPTLYKLFTAVSAVFHDITTSNNAVPCTSGSTNCGPNNFLEGYNAATGYDLATGLGSLDVAKLVANWNTAGLGQPSVMLTAGTGASALGTGAISITHGSTVNFDVIVNPNTATGNVALVNSSGDQDNGAQSLVALSNGSASFSSPSLPGGTYAVQASYSGDADDQPGESNTISLSVAPEPSTLGTVLFSYDPATGAVTNNPTSIPYGMALGLAVTPYGSAGEGKGSIPTGTVNAANSSTTFGSAPLNVIGSTNGGPGSGYIGYFTSGSLLVGSDTISVSYSGDNSYKAATASLGVAVTKAAVTVAPGVGNLPPCSTLMSNWSVAPTCVAGVDVNTDSVGNSPTGTVSITFNGTTQTVPLMPGIGMGANFGFNVVDSIGQTTPIDVTSYVGTYLPTVTATYGGDSNYQAGSGTSTTVQANEAVVSEPTGASFALTNSGAMTIAPGAQGSSTITITPASGFVGQIALTCTVSGGTGTNEPTCSIPTTATVTNSSAQMVTVTVNTTAATADDRKSSTTLLGGETGIVGIGGLLLCGLLIWKRRTAAGLFVFLLFGALIATALTGCGGGGSPISGGSGTGSGGSSGTAAATYTVIVQGSNPNLTYNNGYVSNPITGSTSLTVTVN